MMLSVYAYDHTELPAPSLRKIVDSILLRASAGGFTQSDIFITIMSNGERSDRAIQMSAEIVRCVGGNAAMIDIIRDMKPKGGSQ
ncbi:hypothetical protein [Rugamonas sp.]|uniref:hypothetical protein n=1 Tax=Rugamonas sp. TaxID=1926287 RepID=UPI0025D48D92|nr:hypothetical protein [Rugamonas sp.]